MIEFQLSASTPLWPWLDDPPDFQTGLLMVSWFHHLAQSRLGLTAQAGTSGSDALGRPENFQLGDPTGHNVTVWRTRGSWVFDPSRGLRRETVRAIAEEAVARARTGDSGDGVWCHLGIHSSGQDLLRTGMLHFHRLLGESSPHAGWFGLGDRILVFLDVTSAPGGLSAFADVSGQLYVRGFGPTRGALSEITALALFEFARAAVSFSTGHAFTSDPMLMPMPAQRDDLAAILASRPAELLVNGRSLDVMSLLNVADAGETYRNLRSALFTWESAIQQTNPEVAAVLLVASMEALASLPLDVRWRQDRVTNRFVAVLRQVAGAKLDEIAMHPNAADVFGAVSNGKQLAGRIYEYRSRLAHSGVSRSDLGVGMGSIGSTGVALLSELARDAIVAYASRPFVSLVGHPDISPPPPAGRVLAPIAPADPAIAYIEMVS